MTKKKLNNKIKKEEVVVNDTKKIKEEELFRESAIWQHFINKVDIELLISQINDYDKTIDDLMLLEEREQYVNSQSGIKTSVTSLQYERSKLYLHYKRAVRRYLQNLSELKEHHNITEKELIEKWDLWIKTTQK